MCRQIEIITKYRLQLFGICVVTALLSSGSFCIAEEKPLILEPIVVSTDAESWLGINTSSVRSTQVYPAEEISSLPLTNFSEILGFPTGTDLRRRSPYGIQADFSIRGAGFEQNKVLINGLSVNDPQTGHHNLDLPITSEDLAGVEILKGQGGSLAGAGAMGGAINFLIRQPKGRSTVLAATYGEHALSRQTFSSTFPLRNLNNRISVEHVISSGARPDTDFETKTVSLNSVLDFKKSKINLFAGYTKKDFGADSFYSNLYPQEEEHTRTCVVILSPKFETEILTFVPRILWRRHKDKFILDRKRPSWYVNYHTTDIWEGDFKTIWLNFLGSLAGELTLRREEISSTSLGDHERLIEGFNFSLDSKPEAQLRFNLSGRIEHYPKWDWQFYPTLAGAYKWGRIDLRLSSGRSIRIPSFTELHYDSPANKGNEDLKPEAAWESELGFNWQEGLFQTDLAFFYRRSRDVIDWVRNSTSDPWRAQNISRLDTQGLEYSFELNPEHKNISQISLGYTYIYSDKEDRPQVLSKYALDFLKHKLTLSAETSGLGLGQNWHFSYNQRVHHGSYFLFNLRFFKKIEYNNWHLEVFLTGTNLFDTSYSEQGDVDMPGRWIEAGIRIEL